ncbi:MAG: hypothetical protein IJZ53_03090 [Tyzzerella sp.]|nr:hypothetical protein [Tyzzerella sp.]
MRKFIAMLLTFALCIQMVSQLAVKADASSEKEICDTAWTDDFSTDTISNYKVAGPDTGAWGNWQVVDGKLQVTGNAPADWWGTSLLLKDTIYENFVMEFDADVSAGYGIILRAQDDATTAGSGLNTWFGGNAYVIMHWAPGEGNASVQILDYNGTQDGEVLANVGSIGAMTSAHWKIIAEGNDIIISLTDNNNADNKITYTLNDTRYSSGMMGFYNLTADGVTSFKADNLSVTPMNSTLYADNYSDTSIDDYFVAGPDNGAWGNWQVVDGKLQVTGNDSAAWWGTSILTDADYDNFVMEFDADVSAGYGIFLRAQDDAATQGSGLNAWFGGDTYAIMHWAPVESNASVQVLDYDGTDGGKVLANVGGIGAMASAHWKIAAWGNIIYIKLTDNNNSENTISYILTDSTYSAGHIGFYNLTAAGVTSLKVDNLTIEGYVAPESDEPSISTEKWSDDFSTNTISNYKVAGPDTGAWGNWQVVDGKLQVTGNPGANWWGTSLLLKDAIYDNFVMEFDADVSAGYGIILRAQDDATTAGSGLNTWFSGNAYVIMHWAPVESNASVQILDYNGTDGGEVLANAGSIGAMTSAHWKIIASGSDIVITITDNNNGDNTLTYNLNDARYAAGMMGFYNLTAAGVTSLTVDNLSVTPINNVLHENAFETSDLSEYFVAGPDNGIWGNWQVVDGKLQVTGNPEANWWGTSILTDADYDNFVMEFDADVSAGYGIFLRAQDDAATQGSGLNTWFGGDTYAIVHYRPIESDASVQIMNFSGAENVLANVGSFSVSSSVHWKVVAWGDNIYIKLTDNNNSQNTISYTIKDSTYATGHIGFYNLTAAGVTSLKVDNLIIKGEKVVTGGEEESDTPSITEPETEISWTDDMSSSKGDKYTAYGLWWNNAVSAMTQTDYTGVLGNEGGSIDGITYYYLNDYKFEDFVMEFDVVSTAQGSQYGVVLRAGNPGDGADQGDGYTVMYDGSWVFAGKLNGQFTQITSTPSAYAYNPSDHGVTITHWKVVCVGENIAVYFNGSTEPAIWVTDATYTTGSVGFRAFAPAGVTSNVVIDNVSINGTGTYEEPEDDEPLPPALETYDFEWNDDFESETYNAYLAYGRWWNNAISEFNGEDYSDILANEGGIADGVCYYYLRKYKWADFEMEFDVPSTDSTAQYGVVLRASTYSDAPDDCGGYTVMYDGNWIFVGKLNGSFVQVTNTPSAYAYNPSEHGITPEHWKITCVGNTIQVYLNGSATPIISVNDSDFNCGYVGFRTFAKGGDHTNVVFDNLHIKGSVLVEELTTKINSNRRSGTVYDYSTLVESAKKTDKVVVKDDSLSSDTTEKENTSSNADNKGTTSNKVNINSTVNKTDTSTDVTDKAGTPEKSEDKNDVLESDKDEADKDMTDASENEEEDHEVSGEEQYDGNAHRWIIPTAIIALLVVVAAEVIIIAKKRKK